MYTVNHVVRRSSLVFLVKRLVHKEYAPQLSPVCQNILATSSCMLYRPSKPMRRWWFRLQWSGARKLQDAERRGDDVSGQTNF
jgi:hypothetical protein